MPKPVRRGLLALTASCVGVTAIVALLPNVAFAASPVITSAMPNPTVNDVAAIDIVGSGFTPGDQVRVQVVAFGYVLSTTETTASQSSLVCASGGLKPVCHSVGGGYLNVVVSSSPYSCEMFPDRHRN